MYKAKDLHHTEAYQQLRRAVEVNYVGDKGQRASALGRLVSRVLANLNNQVRANYPRLYDDIDIDGLIVWDETPEGHNFWNKINVGGRLEQPIDSYPRHKHQEVVPQPIAWAEIMAAPVALKPVKEEKAQKVLGWWGPID